MTRSPDANAESIALETARDVLARNREGALLIDGSPFDVRFIDDPATGDLIAPLPREATETTDLTMFVPEESFEALQLLVTASPIAECSLTDRWCAYHHAPNHPVWCRVTIDSGKHERWVFMGEALGRPNPIADDEAALCRMLNEDKPTLASVVERVVGVEIPDPVCVGVNERGLYIRGKFSVVLARFETPAIDADQARARVERWLERERGATR